MVFFTCNACGESLKKAQVEKHVNQCRGCEVLSCIDCGKDFWGSDYKNHLRCISEDQKYGGKDFQAKANKGDVKQQQWIQRIHDAMDKPGVSQKMKDILGQVTAYDNIPRKKAKFQGAEAPKPSPTPEETPAEVTAQNGSSEELAPKDEKKKLNKRERKEARQQKNGKVRKGSDAPDTASKFNWKGTIKTVIRQSPDHELSVKKLRKKVLAAYYSFSGERNFKTEEQLLALFNKKIKSNPKFRVLKDKVKLVD
ncbi:hypothetical protein NHX12_029640 [Muraenolepis orangiensis]|uniref:Cell growth-regulating nucleolar protein n=1 Tax=Muraenolepis orangiensis TaxID=630683 RepID=A0A9Q0EA92_9TELE|nr:hypothetical protein NHX12_029640 [Muraenolepis orangiensis]